MEAHLKGFGLENFRVFKDKTWFDFAPITILTGTNNSGKSSLVRAVNLLSNFFEAREMKLNEENEIPDLMDIEELLGILGDFSKLPNNTSDSNTISFYLPFQLRGIIQKLKLKLDFTLQDEDLKQGKLNGISILLNETDEEIFHCKELQELKYTIRIDYSFFLKEYQRESEIEHLSDQLSRINMNSNQFFKSGFMRNKAEKRFFHYLDDEQKLLLTKTDFFEFLNVENKRKQSGKDFFGVSQSEYEKIEEEFLKYFEISIEYKVNNEQVNHSFEGTNRFDYENIDLARSYWLEKNKSLLNKFTPIISPLTFGTSRLHDYSSSDLNINCQSMGEIYSKNLIVRCIEEGKALVTDASDINYFFFKYFICQNIRCSLHEVTNNLLDKANFISSSQNSLDRIYNAKQNPRISRVLKQLETNNKDLRNNPYFDFIEKYICSLGFGTGVEFVKAPEGIGTRIYLIDKDKKTLLADMGYGVSQLLPLILQIVLAAIENKNYEISNAKLFVEEPEANLHPALQSKLADMFVEAAKKFNIQFVIETHSEYLIRRLQVLTANTYTVANKNENWVELKTTDTQLYYFYQADAVPEGEEQVYKINIEEDGALTKNFGRGFFDESSKWNIALYSYTKANKN